VNRWSSDAQEQNSQRLANHFDFLVIVVSNSRRRFIISVGANTFPPSRSLSFARSSPLPLPTFAPYCAAKLRHLGVEQCYLILPEGRSTIHEPGRRELPTQSYIRPLSWLDTNLSRQEPEEEDLVPASSDKGLWQRSKRQKVYNILLGYDEFCISMFNSTK